MAYLDDNIPEGALSAYRDYISEPPGEECPECGGTGEVLEDENLCEDCESEVTEVDKSERKHIGSCWQQIYIESLYECKKCGWRGIGIIDICDCKTCGGTGWIEDEGPDVDTYE